MHVLPLASYLRQLKSQYIQYFLINIPVRFRCKIVKRILVIFSHVDFALRNGARGTNDGVREKELSLAR
jgi:hypothetical protein